MPRRLTLAALLLALVAGCDDPPPPAPRFFLFSEIDIPVEVFGLPPGHQPFENLHLLRADPGAEIRAALAEDGSTLLADLEADLPEALAGQVEGWLDEALVESQEKV